MLHRGLQLEVAAVGARKLSLFTGGGSRYPRRICGVRPGGECHSSRGSQKDDCLWVHEVRFPGRAEVRRLSWARANLHAVSQKSHVKIEAGTDARLGLFRHSRDNGKPD